MTEDRKPRGYPLFSIMAANTFLLSVIYLVGGLGVELARRYHPTPFVLKVYRSMDNLPVRALELAGAWNPLRRAFFTGRLSNFWVRVIFCSTTIVIIFVLALLVGLLMGGLRGWLVRRELHRSGGPRP